MKLGQLIEYNMRNIFLEKSYTKCCGETTPRQFLEIKIEHISGLIDQSFLQFVFIVCQVDNYRNILKLSWRTLSFTSYKTFLKSKKRSGTSPPA